MQHINTNKRNNLKDIYIITGEDYNKSVILDLESFLIKYVAADGKFKLQNSSSGTIDHNYFDRKTYKENFNKIWQKLKSLNLVTNDIENIENSELFKYSPYKALTKDQEDSIREILNIIVKSSNIIRNHQLL